MYCVPFVSQRQYAQAASGCGVASTMMLLKYHYRRKHRPSYRELRRELAYPTGQSELGVELDNVTAYLRRQGVRHRATRTKSPNQITMLLNRVQIAPVMVGMGRNRRRWGVDGHWIVLIGSDGENVIFLNPAHQPTRHRPSRIRLADFRRQWDGSSVQIVGFH
jgi:ABC-type bacteriocin/lantibiotic exporter with double-glycine peptidase domain